MWTKAFILQLLENSLTAGVAAVAGYFGAITTTITVKDLYPGLIAGGTAALYTFAKGLGAVQVAKNERNAPKAAA